MIDLNEMGQRARRAARVLALAPTERKNAALEAIAEGFDPHGAVLLGDELRRERPAAPDGQVLYKSIGSPVQDLVLAAKIIDQARADGFGRTQSPLSAVKVNL